MVTQLPPPSPENNDSPRHSRLEEEVLEILQQSERPISFTERVRARAEREQFERRARLSNRAHSARVEVTPGMMLIGAIIAALLAWWVSDFSGLLARVLAIVSVDLLVVPIILQFRRPSRSVNSKRWRGRDVSFSNGQPAWYNDLRDRLKRPPRK
jgi:hypothetical protein